MELMAGNDEEIDGVEPGSKSANRSSKFGSGRYFHRGRNQSQTRGYDDNVFRWRRNQSAGGSSEMFSRKDVVSHLKFSSHEAEDISI